MKLRGLRIELGEIEAVLHEHPDVAAAVVAVHDDRLVAYLVARPPRPVERRPRRRDGVAAYARARLPANGPGALASCSTRCR